MVEAWLDGPVEGIDQRLMPAAHCLLDALGDLERAAASLTAEQLWMRPGGAASVAFHLMHVGGSLDRLLTYARGEGLTPAQFRALEAERNPTGRRKTAVELLAALRVKVVDALDAYRAASPDTLFDHRAVGRRRLASNVLGLFFHAAEHARRHAGQVVATAKIIQGLGLGTSTKPRAQ